MGPLDAVICLDKSVARGAGTVALAGSVGACVTWFCSGRLFVGGVIGVYASAITAIMQTSVADKPTKSQIPHFFAVSISSAVALCLLARLAGFTLSISTACILTAATVASVVTGLNLF